MCLAGCLSAQVVLNTTPSRQIGHPRLVVSTVAPNFVEGRETNVPQGIAIDSSVSPPILYVADTGNNRVLAWRNSLDSQSGIAADLIIGQRDRTSTLALGPGTSLASSGLAQPTGLAVDRNGNLYVADSGNNRILRFPRPFDQQGGEFVTADMVIGQQNFTTRSAGTTDSTVGFITSAQILRVGLAFDPQGNLWMSDPGNNRVLRYPVTALTAGRSGPAADVVLGQSEFTTNFPVPAGTLAQRRVVKTNLQTPSGVTVDATGRLYVCDLLNRVMVYQAPLATGIPATRILGIVILQTGQAPPAVPNDTNLGIVAANGLTAPPEGVFMIGDRPAVIDNPSHRIVVYPPPGEWTPESSTQFSPRATVVIGQQDFNRGMENRGLPSPDNNTFNFPVAAIALGNNLHVADTANNRILTMTGAPNFSTASRVLGQVGFAQNAPNLIEGREFFFLDRFSAVSGIPASFANGAGMALDGNRLYVADPLNNRVLAFRDIRTTRPDDRADVVIGQPDAFRSLINSPNNEVDRPTDSSLFLPAAVAVDGEGNLFVTDSGNGRVLRFPRPFDAAAAGSPQRANLVLGQTSFTTRITDASSRTMARPFGLAFTVSGSLLVSDAAHNRILFFEKPAGGDFTNGQAAVKVFGQANFVTSTTTTELGRLVSPRGISIDTDDRLYVADTGKNRMVIYNRVPDAGVDPQPALTFPPPNPPAGTGLSSPHGVFVSKITGEIWVADTIGNRALRYPRFDVLVQTQVPDAAVGASNPLGVVLDNQSNLIVAEGRNRISIFYPGLSAINGANFLLSRSLAPGTITSLFTAVNVTDQTLSFDQLPAPVVPLPVTIADVQVLLNDQPVPLYFVSPRQINFLVPNGAPTSGDVDLLVVRPSTGQILVAGRVRMNVVSPGLFTAASNGNGQISALNQDNTVNSAANAAVRGSVVQMFGTGQGFVAGAPPDGTPPSGAVNAQVPRVIIGTSFVPDSDILYSGLAPGLVGVWQVNVRIPESVAAGVAVPCSVVLRDIPNNLLPQRTTIAVKNP